MGRHELREQIFRLLFRVEFHTEQEMTEQTKLFFEEEELAGISEKDMNYVKEKCAKIREALPVLDQSINEKAEGWDTARMGKVELTILRLAIYEIQKDEEVPGSVAINEAVELAKSYGQENSGGFVNAILAKFV